MPERFGQFTIAGDRSLPVHPALPDGGIEVKPDDWGLGAIIAGLKPYHRCPRCKGYIEGHPVERREDSLAPLSGRRGVSSHCRRCDRELHFSGMVS